MDARLRLRRPTGLALVLALLLLLAHAGAASRFGPPAGAAELARSAQATPAPEVITGRLDLPRPAEPCGHDAIVRQCFTGDVHLVRSDTDLSPFLGYDVRIEAVRRPCEAGGGSYLQLLNISMLPDGCGPTPTPLLTPTPAPVENMAQGAPLAVRDAVPGWPAQGVNDGNVDTAWRSDAEATWIYVDLGRGLDRPRTFNQVVLHWGEAFASRYALYVWEQDSWSGIYQTLASADGGEDVISLPRTYARFVLLYLVGSADVRGYELREWEIYGRETINQALGGAIDVSSVLAEHPGHLANDSDRRTFWQSLPPAEDAHPWLRIWLPGVYVAELRLYWVEDRFPLLFTVVIYDGDQMRQSTWQPRTSVNRIAPPAPIRADAVLVYSRVPSKEGPVALQEIELYENALAAVAQTTSAWPPAQVARGVLAASAAAPAPWSWLSSASAWQSVGAAPAVRTDGFASGPVLRSLPEAGSAPARWRLAEPPARPSLPSAPASGRTAP